MKKTFFILFLLIIPFVLAKPVINDYVIDEAELLSPATEQELRNTLQQLEQETTTEFVIVTIKNLEGEPIEDYALALAHENIGQKDKDNGLLLLISLEDRAYRIEVGQGLEGVLNDAKAGKIARDNLIPAFQQEKYEKGIVNTAQQLILAVKGEYTAEPTINQQVKKIQLWIIIGFVIFIIILSLFGKKEGRRNGGFIWFGGLGGLG